MKLKNFFGILLSLALIIGLMPGMSLTAYAETVVKYLDDYGDEVSCSNYIELTDTTNIETETWYVVTSDVSRDNLDLSNDKRIRLILCDGCTLTASSINLGTSGCLTVYAGSTGETISGSGALNVSNSTGNAVNAGEDCLMTINGGVVTLSSKNAVLDECGYLNFNGGVFTGSSTDDQVIPSNSYIGLYDVLTVKAGDNETNAVVITNLGEWDRSDKWVKIGTTSTSTTEYPLYVGGTQVTSGNADNIDGNNKASYNASTHTLTLNNYEYEGAGHNGTKGQAGIYYDASDDLTVELNGNNSIKISGTKMTTTGIGNFYTGDDPSSQSYSKLSFTGGGSLNVDVTTSNSYTGYASGIFSYGDLSFENCTIKCININGGYGIESGNRAVTFGEGCNIEAYGMRYGIKPGSGTPNPPDRNVVIESNVQSVLIYGGQSAVAPSVGNLITSKSGVGYQTEDGTGSESKIEAGTTVSLRDNTVKTYKRLEFPKKAYSVSYDGNGATSGKAPTDSNSYSPGATVTVLGNTGSLANTGKDFDGWNTKADGSGTSYTEGGTFAISENTTLYAKWSNKKAKVTKAPTAQSLTYTGSAQKLVTAGESDGGTMQYALGTETEATEEYTTSVPTATDAGTYYVWYKAVGNESYSDSEPKVVTVKITEVHTHKIKSVEEKEPTCTEDGYEAHYECSECGAWFEDVYGHHQLSETEKAEITKKATGHKWDEGEVTQEATYDEEGIKTYTCTKCDATKEETIPKKTRSYSSDSDSSDSDSESSGGGSSGKSGSISTKSIDVNGNTVQTQPDSGAPLSDRGGNWGNQEHIWTYTKSDGSLAKGEWLNLEYNGHTYWYYFDDSTIMQTNWFDYNGSRYFLVPEMDGWRGRMATGWHQVDNKWYYFEPTIGANQGILYRGMTTPDGHTVGADGAWDGNGTTPVGAIHTGTTVTMN